MACERILIVEDEENIRNLLSFYLEREQYEVQTAQDGQEALQLASLFQPHLILLDIMLPKLDGYDVCRELRKTLHIPIIFVSARDEETDKILGLGVGGDDYIVKPFSPRELIARIKAHLRRYFLLSSLGTATPLNVIHYGELEINLTSHVVKLRNRVIMLSIKEFKLLSCLIQHPNRIYSVQQLFDLVWGMDSLGDTRTVMVHLSNLRKKIESDIHNPKYIVNVRGMGYKFIPAD
ncbi:response regulator transcription factor [Paenibacillus campi]|uniref:response regulator transcription factor n=1 Tax=Paenibacillus campi TaxID=3106031 RepID=UPI002AFE1C36|nr:response regulator transcription factor [Paenibacillus sp. SGZ-1014]